MLRGTQRLIVTRMPTTTQNALPRLDKTLLQRLATLRDDHGVVTVLAARGATSEAEIRTTLRRGGATLSALADEAAALANPRLEGPAHGLVAALSTGEMFRFQLPLPVAILVTVGSHADIAPIARALDGARPVGIVDARLDRLRIVEAADGEAHELEGTAFSAATGDWSEFRGPARANPARAYQSSSQRERYDRRVRVQRSRSLKDAGRRISELARERHWRALVIAGDPHVTGDLAPELPALFRIQTHLPAWESAGQLVRDLAHELDDARRSPILKLTAAAHARPAAFAIGPEAVRAAIDDGRAFAVIMDGPALDRELGEVTCHALAHNLDVFFADGQLGDLKGVICALHGTKGTPAKRST